jgi:hypothetical protein
VPWNARGRWKWLVEGIRLRVYVVICDSNGDWVECGFFINWLFHAIWENVWYAKLGCFLD